MPGPSTKGQSELLKLQIENQKKDPGFNKKSKEMTEKMIEENDRIKAITKVDYEPTEYKRVNELLEIVFGAYTFTIKERVELSEILVDYIRYDVPQQIRDACE